LQDLNQFRLPAIFHYNFIRKKKEAALVQTNNLVKWTFFGVSGLLLGVSFPGVGQVMSIRSEMHHDVSPAVRDLPISNDSHSALREAEPVRTIPLPPGLKPAEDPDTVRQQTTAAPSSLAPTSNLNFDGIGQGVFGFNVGVAPPDTNGAVGVTQYVQWVNLSFAVFNKSSGALIKGPVAGNSLWQGFGGPCETNNSGDPIVTYDKLANRWVFSQFAVASGPPFLQCLAVSTTSDATGTFNRYSFAYSNFDDYPKMGVWPDAYYVTFNMFNGNTFVGADACAYNRSAMLNGQSATQICFQQGSSVGGLLPSDVDGTTAPPAGSPNYMLFFGTNALKLFKFHVDFANPSASTITGPTSIPVAAFTPLCNGSRGCVPQAGTTTQLDSLADRLMYRLAYRNFGTHESLVVNHSVAASSSGGIRWYEIQNPNGSPVVAQQSTFAPDAKFRWMGSIAMDQVGDIAIGYSVSSSAMNPSIAFAGRAVSDPTSTLEPETTIIAGTGSQTGGLTRWGDYSAMQVDPSDDCTFWYTTEYLKSNGSFNWNTRIANFKFGNCQSGLAISVSPSSINFFNHFQNDPPVSRTVSVNNTGTATISFSSIALMNGFAYSVSSQTCGSSLAAGGSCTITVTFTPADASPGTNTDTLLISDNVPGTPQKVTMTGTLSCPSGGCL
jgi:hypothetical protein